MLERLESVREEAGLSASKFSLRCGWTRGQYGVMVGRLRDGTTKGIERVTAEVIEDRFGVRREWLMHGTGPRYVDATLRYSEVEEVLAEYPNASEAVKREVRGMMFNSGSKPTKARWRSYIAAELLDGLDEVPGAWSVLRCRLPTAEVLDTPGLAELGLTGDVEQLVEAITGAIVMPRAAFVRETWRLRMSLDELARRFVTTQTAVTLRLAEVGLLSASAVVHPQFRFVRGPLPRDLSSATKKPLTDAPRRIALLCA